MTTKRARVNAPERKRERPGAVIAVGKTWTTLELAQKTARKTAKGIVLKTARAAVVPTEHEEQAAVVAWAKLWSVTYPKLGLLFAIPNGAYKSHATAAKFQREGLRAGVPDLMLPVAMSGQHGLFLECKRVRGGVVSPAQAGWHVALRAQGYRVSLCYGAREAMVAIAEYLQLPTSVRPRE